MTPSTNRRFHAILKEAGFTDPDHIREMVQHWTQGQKSSRKDLTDDEALGIIDLITSDSGFRRRREACQRMRRKLIAMAREMGWEKVKQVAKGGITSQKVVADMAAIEDWCKTRGMYKKGLNAHTYKELPQLLTQFERVYLSTISK